MLPVVIGLTKAVSKIETSYCTSVRTGLINAVRRRLGYVESDDHFIVSSVLEPRFKLKWATTTASVMNVKSSVIALMEREQSDAAVVLASTDPPNVEAVQNTAFDDDDLFGFMACSDALTDSAVSPVAELDRYLADSSTAETLLFWAANKENYPALHKLHGAPETPLHPGDIGQHGTLFQCCWLYC